MRITTPTILPTIMGTVPIGIINTSQFVHRHSLEAALPEADPAVGVAEAVGGAEAVGVEEPEVPTGITTAKFICSDVP